MPDVRDTIDDMLTSLWIAIRDRQIQYASNHNGNYWQGLITHSVIPADGAELPPNAMDNFPSDQAISWRQFKQQYPFTLPVNIPMALRSDVYDGPLGKGFVITVFVYYNGKLWTRAQQYGPETWHTHGWEQLIEVV